MQCHVMLSCAVPCHAICLRFMACHDHSVSCHVKTQLEKWPLEFLKKCQTYMAVLCQEYIMLFFCLPLSSQRASLLLCAEEFEPWLTAQWQTEKQHAFLAEDGHILLTCLQLVGTWVQNVCSGMWFQMFGVSCSKCCMSWCVNIYRVNKFRVVSYQNSACQRVHAMSWPPCKVLFSARPKCDVMDVPICVYNVGTTRQNFGQLLWG